MAKEDGDPGVEDAALQVIVLGSGGGPQEHNVTALLVRSVKSGWARGSIVALDAGVHLSAITRILEETQPRGLGTDVALPHTLGVGPFAGMQLTSAKASANAGYITRHLIDTYLITHPHLDHISGFVINTAGLPGSRPKRLAGLPSTISAFKSHIFNNVIWPNLSDENNGAGLVTYMRLVEGGSPALGEGDGKGYLEISDGLSVKLFSVSHGHCIEKHAHRGSASSSRFESMDASSMPMASPRGAPGSNAASGPSPFFRSSGMGHSSVSQEKDSICVYDSSAYFIRDAATGREVLMFGDVEPDSISLSPRNLGVWQEAAPRIANGNLRAIFIECSYDDSQTEDRLFGHLTPRFIIEEMKTLAGEVYMARQPPVKLELNKKRKRDLEEGTRRSNRAAARSSGDENPVSPKTTRPAKRSSGGSVSGTSDHGIDTPHIATPTAEMSLRDSGVAGAGSSYASSQASGSLSGLKVVIIHVKEKLDDHTPVRDIILSELLEHEEEAQLGCEFIISTMGQSFML
ncbi:Uu.00g082790.m01.CDS01 [Anthostomella pinea]|uniref:Uu.00g082790.m01.CDS01 n=1 Tax=Anthostomella pinea TaxID=933095 RepID=A0AAI8VLI6_9PEZI|nr:Uu.00g082790.m01.CDS01 [Anthostomella pinea]